MSTIQETLHPKGLSWVAKTVGIAVAYFVLGKLALLLAIPPGYATAVWPAAGIALAGVLLYGYRVWPGVFIGSFFITASNSLDLASATIVDSAALAAGIAGGAALQAVLGALLVRRFVGLHSFDRLRRIVGVMVVGGPLACLTSATIGVASGYLVGDIEAVDLMRNWGTWWLGDSIGVLTVIPLVSMWRAELHGASRRTRLFVSLPILGAFVLTVLAFLDTRVRELERAQGDFERRAEIMARALHQAVLSKIDIVQSVVSLFETRGEVDRSEFRVFVARAFARHRDLHGLSWNALVSADRRAAVEAAMRQGPYGEFLITERNAEGVMVPARDRAEHVVVFYIEPFEGNEQALGFDLASDPVRARALEAARDTGQTIATPPIILVQETESKPGFLLVAPIYGKGLPHETLAQRRRNLHSFVSGVFRAEEMVEAGLAAFQAEGIDYAIADTSDPEEARVLYGDRMPSEQATGLRAKLAWSTDLEIAGRRWTVRLRASPSYRFATQWGKVWLVLTGGLVFTSLLGAFLVVIAGRAAATARANEDLRQVMEERWLAQAALSASEARFRGVFENAAVGVGIVKADELIGTSNAALQRFLGYSAEELAAKKLSELTHPKDVAASVTRFRELLAGSRSSYDEEKRWITKSGETVWGHSSVSLVRDAGGEPLFAVGMIQDITERKRHEKALLYTQLSVDRSVDGIFWVEEDAHFSYVNDAACRLVGFSRETLLTKTVIDVDVNFSREMWPEFWASVRGAENLVIESVMRRSDGTLFPAEIAINYMEVEGSERCVASVRDTTERKKAEEERLEFEARVQQAQKLESLGVLAGGIAHDFNNLLVGVLGNADLAMSQMAPASPARGYVRDIEASAQRAADLANQLLAYSGKGRFVVEPIDLSELVEEVAHLVEVAVSKKVTVKYDLARDLPALEADATQVRQVVLNLITNASEAIGETTGVVSITTGQMECDTDYLASLLVAEKLPEGRYVFAEVSDTGSGMDEEVRAKIFDPFFTTKFTGRGLGLAAALGIVRGHKGAIKVYSEPGRGTTVKVLFPASRRSAPKHAGPQTDGATWAGKGTVLVVDDEAMVRQVAANMLAKMGFSVLQAADGVEALSIFRERADDIALVLVDLAMPRMGGEEAFAELRRIKDDVKVILSSGYNEEDTTRRFSGKGLAGFIQKPYRLDALRDLIRAVLADD